MKEELPCKKCIVYAVCKTKIQKSDLDIFSVIHDCPLLKDFLEAINTTNISIEWSNDFLNRTHIIKNKITQLVDYFKISRDFLERT